MRCATRATAAAAFGSRKSADGSRMADVIRGFAGTVRRMPERLLHPVRRARMHRALAGVSDSPTILVVCLGNICRSPYACLKLQVEFQKRGRDDILVKSAGFIFPDRPSPPEAQRAAAHRGLDLAPHRSQVMEAETVNSANLILVMSRMQQLDLAHEFGRTKTVLILGDADPGWAATRTVKDPIDQPIEVFESVFDRLDRCCASIVDAISAKSRRDGRPGDKTGEAR